jgi:hypothetical protein
MEKSSNVPVQHEELSRPTSYTAAEEKRNSITIHAKQEHEWTVGYVLTHHKKLVFWTFFWAMCGVGW